MSNKLVVAIAAGGTAGHINPALALAEELRERGHEVSFYGQARRLEGTLVPQAGFSLHEVDVTGFDRRRPWTILTALIRMYKAQCELAAHFAAHGAPNVAVGFGAYIELPLMRWCSAAGVPYVIHEQNSVPGLANKLCAPKAKTVCVSLPVATEAFAKRVSAATQIVVSGNPVRRKVVDASREAGRAAFGVSEDETLLLVFGGSLGARHLNQGVIALKDELLARANLRIVHSTGRKLYDEVCDALTLSEQEAKRWQLMPYITNMGEALAAADAVLSRAGASSIAEIAALATPSMLVPYPLATADHQTTNARYLVDAGAASMIADEQIDSPEFSQMLLRMLDDARLREKMRAAGRGLGQANAAAELANQVEAAAC